ncbi:thymopoietin a isoform X4 [Astyanax mexicanus]|uniref:thymopoietin a isoform X4 n=1 Tax=Astyanax mexicanus TaxID=7994 RepID=UPI0020CB1213|nr:thymopoietin a isoform X4 [Astyanax mexicanus]
MSEFLQDPSVLTKDKLKSALLAHNVALPNGEQRKGVYVDLYLKNLTAQNRRSAAPEPAFSSDEEPPAPVLSGRSRSGRKATRKTDRVRPEEIDVTELTNEGLKDQLLKYGVNAGPIVASTRKLYEKKLQKLLDQGPPETVVQLSEPAVTGNSQNGNTDSDQYSDKEEEATKAEPEPEPEPVPVVERPMRSRGKAPVTTRTRSGQHKQLKDDYEEEDFQVLNVQRKSRRTSRRVDQTVPASDDTDFSELSAAETLPTPRERARPSSVPKDPKPLLADRPSSISYVTKSSLNDSSRYSNVTPTHSAFYNLEKDFSSEKGLSQEPKSASLAKQVKRCVQLQPASAQPSEDLIHMMCRLSPPAALQPKTSLLQSASVDSPHRPATEDPPPASLYSSKEDFYGSSSALLRGKQTKLRTFLSPVTPVREKDNSFGDEGSPLIEKLSAVEQTPKTPDRDVLKELFPNETLNTPTGISATRRQPIKGAAGRSFSDSWRDDLRPRLTEIRHTSSSSSSSSYTETRSAIHRTNAVPLNALPLSSILKPAAPPAVQVKTRRRLPVWLQLLLLSAVAGFLFFVYQAMETNEMNPFGQSASSGALGSTSK